MRYDQPQRRALVHLFFLLFVNKQMDLTTDMPKKKRVQNYAAAMATTRPERRAKLLGPLKSAS